MKIVLDIDKLLAEKRISADQYAQFKKYAAEDTGSLAFNILIGFGAVATAGGAVALFPSAATAVLLGLIISVAGAYLRAEHLKAWGLLGSILLLVGSLGACGGIVIMTKGSMQGFLLVTILCLLGGVFARSGLLVSLSVFALSETVGVATAYSHASYFLIVQQPTVTVVLFSLLSVGAYLLSLRTPEEYRPIPIAFARTSLFLVNFGFWVGSLWGDPLGRSAPGWNYRGVGGIPDMVFVLGWAIGLILTGIWAAQKNKRWVVNLVAVFGAIHFYTQYFERLGASPSSILVAGLAALGIAIGIVQYNKSFKPVEAN
jgi:iron complex transport system permease protein